MTERSDESSQGEGKPRKACDQAPQATVQPAAGQEERVLGTWKTKQINKTRQLLLLGKIKVVRERKCNHSTS